MEDWQDRQENLLHCHLTKSILKCCFEVINTLGTGFLESVYKNSLQIALLDKCIILFIMLLILSILSLSEKNGLIRLLA